MLRCRRGRAIVHRPQRACVTIRTALRTTSASSCGVAITHTSVGVLAKSKSTDSVHLCASAHIARAPVSDGCTGSAGTRQSCMRLRGSRTLADDATESGMGETAVRVSICDLHAPKTCPKEDSVRKARGKSLRAIAQMRASEDQHVDAIWSKALGRVRVTAACCQHHPCFA